MTAPPGINIDVPVLRQVADGLTSYPDKDPGQTWTAVPDSLTYAPTLLTSTTIIPWSADLRASCRTLVSTSEIVFPQIQEKFRSRGGLLNRLATEAENHDAQASTDFTAVNKYVPTPPAGPPR